ncbi:heat shock protein Hsp33 [Lysobacter daejeonensis GH1-9]|uniref:Heat shock protein Hsp33 n=1 Tax=Lysobacter daejeonensis GH1-9 TaxID=1385517 RepID=A0A0A0EYS8_9GAMM|nr:Hsp33 family molecular chaperone HslO [Lysobacter daejeonensis]KGM55218.1 heat shock protein Hsp33 [Lysobacter daejeonensis GH1-9]
MTDATPTTIPDDRDQLTRFLLEDAGVRGVLVHLDDTWQQIRRRATGTPHDGVTPPASVVELLGEAVAASALFTGHAKVEGRLSVQLRSSAVLRTLFAECTAAGTLRGIAQLSGDGPVSRDLRELGDDALLAITIENPALGNREPVRYQGLVALDSDTLAGAFEGYFRQSEQLPTRLLLAVDDTRAAGLMLQKLPGDSGDADGWNHVGALFDTLGPAELLATDTATLLTRLFHEGDVRLLGSRALRFACSCSRERVESMLVSLGADEARAAVADDEAKVRCEFCGEEYRFSSEQIEQLLEAAKASFEAPERAQ